MEFRKRYTLSLDDYLTYNRYSHRKHIILMPALFTALMLAVCLFIVFAGRTTNFLTITVIAALVLLFAGVIAASNIMMLNHQAKRQYNSSHSLKSEFELSIDKNGVRETGSSGSSNAKWEQVKFAVESKKAIYIHLSTLRAFVIPTRQLNLNEYKLIRKLLDNNLHGRRNRLRR